jgi:hypothetical protein
MEYLIAWGATTLIGAFIGSYLAGYLKKKGENLATHEDIDKLVDQVRAVTTATQEIEARISNEVWDRQRSWELKKETLLDAARALAVFESAVGRLNATYYALKDISDKDSPLYVKHEAKALTALSSASRSFDRAQLLVSLVSGKDVEKSFLVVNKMLMQLSKKITDGDSEVYSKSLPELRKAGHDLVVAVRKELGVE